MLLKTGVEEVLAYASRQLSELIMSRADIFDRPAAVLNLRRNKIASAMQRRRSVKGQFCAPHLRSLWASGLLRY